MRSLVLVEPWAAFGCDSPSLDMASSRAVLELVWGRGFQARDCGPPAARRRCGGGMILGRAVLRTTTERNLGRGDH